MSYNHNHSNCGSNQQSFGTNFYDPDCQHSNSQTGCHQVPSCNGCLDVVDLKCTIYTSTPNSCIPYTTGMTGEAMIKALAAKICALEEAIEACCGDVVSQCPVPTDLGVAT